MNAAVFEGVSKSYPVYSSPASRLKELATFNRRSFHRDFWALRDLSFEIRRGEMFCVIGENGAGKSTLLELLAGVIQPTSGILAVNGAVAALLELGSGFNPEFSGRDNVYLSAALAGLSRRDTDRMYPEIETFAEIGAFIDQPVKTYSSGMAVRLAFAVAIHVEPQILLVDEALSVGDSYFRQRCLRKVHELRSRGVTIVFVSHSMADVKAIGDRALWLDHGRIRELGDTEAVIAQYLEAMAEKDAEYLRLNAAAAGTPLAAGSGTPCFIEGLLNVDRRHGDGRAAIAGIAVLDPKDRPLRLLEPGTRIVVRISARAADRLAQPEIGFVLRNHLGIDFAGTSTGRESKPLAPLAPGDTITVDFHIDLPDLYPANFSFSPRILDGECVCDCVENALTLQMGHAAKPVYGYIHLPARIETDARLTPAQEAARV